MSVNIEVEKLTKFYSNEALPAVSNLNLQVSAGEIYGFLGANGAGKSTTLRLMMGFLKPSSGSIKIMGKTAPDHSSNFLKYTGYLAGDVALFQKVTGRQLLDFLSQLSPATSYRQVLEKRFAAQLDKPIENMSKGNRQKIGIIQAFMHKPAVLILDEPTSGLDPLMQEAFYETVAESKSNGAAILMSSHNLNEAQRICDRIGIIKQGKLILEQSLTENSIIGKTIFKIELVNSDDILKIKKSKEIKYISQDSPHVILVSPTKLISGALRYLSQFEIKAIATQEINLEDEFLEFYGDSS
ncbi:MAG: ABC transporter ATP-binding protein [Candidatus Saccharimonadales bacterium]